MTAPEAKAIAKRICDEVAREWGYRLGGSIEHPDWVAKIAAALVAASEPMKAPLNRARQDAIAATERACADECREQAKSLEANGQPIASVWAASGCALRIERRRKQGGEGDETS